MLFNSIDFLIFFPIVLLVYYIIPKKISYLWLLVASYYFYMCWNAKYALLILFSTVATYAGGMLIAWAGNKPWDDKKKIRTKKVFVALTLILNLAVLFYFKYANFAIDTLTSLFDLVNVRLKIPSVDVLLPVGISFYTFQALSYTMDVYRGDIEAEKNFLRYALFVSFFPQLVAGPIERSGNLLGQLKERKPFSYDRARYGFLLMLWGFFLKIVLADRIAIFVDTVYGNYEKFGGWYIVIATVLFAFQIYCDFYGYSTIAIGASQILGIKLMENFDSPYLSVSVAQFWRKWHISLTSWFKDYLYIPLGGSRKGKFRKYINKLIVFLVSGLWHGASLSFVVWGGLNGIYQIIGELLDPIKNKIFAAVKINREFVLIRWVRMLITFILVDFTWIFFRAGDLESLSGILKSIFNLDNFHILKDGALYHCGLDQKNFALMLVCLLVLFIADAFKHCKIKLSEVLIKQNYFIRILVMIFAICAILTFGIWGSGYDKANFIYFQF